MQVVIQCEFDDGCVPLSANPMTHSCSPLYVGASLDSLPHSQRQEPRIMVQLCIEGSLAFVIILQADVANGRAEGSSQLSGSAVVARLSLSTSIALR